MNEEYAFSKLQEGIALIATAGGCTASMVTKEDFPERFTDDNPVGLVLFQEEEKYVIHEDGIVEFVPSGEKTTDPDEWMPIVASLIAKRESEPAFDVETRRAREEMEAGNEKTEYPFGEGETA